MNTSDTPSTPDADTAGSNAAGSDAPQSYPRDAAPRSWSLVREARVRSRSDTDEQREDLAYWLSRPPEERIDAVNFLRRRHYGDLGRLQRVVHIIQRPRG
jgi:hypothetical protein